MAHSIQPIDERFEFLSKLKTNVFILIGTGLVLFVIGLLMSIFGGEGDHGHSHDTGHAKVEKIKAEGYTPSTFVDSGHGSELDKQKPEDYRDEVHSERSHGDHAASHGSIWLKKLKVSLWHNGIFFMGISLIGIFFVAIQYVSNSGWSVQLKRVSESLSTFLPIPSVILIFTFFIASHDLFHWTHTDHGLYDPADDHYDAIIAGKKGMFFFPGVDVPSFPVFFVVRLFLIIAVWIAFAYYLRLEGYREDQNGGIRHHRRSIIKSGLFIIFFALTVSITSWDWIMSIDTHWFSTMFGWYVFASWFVTGLSVITLLTISLKENGFLKNVNENHFHDLGKYIFAFSIFWTYVWFSQFLLIYYANIPEETVYFFERLRSSNYYPLFFLNLIFNFAFPFLGLMTRDAKRQVTILKIVCTVVIIGHWIDFFLMIAPGTLKESGTIGLLEIGIGVTLFGLMLLVAYNQLTKVPLIQKNHPMLEESLHHHI